jgi:hypothetical protein
VVNFLPFRTRSAIQYPIGGLNRMIYSSTIEHEIKLGFKVHDYRSILLKFKHDIAFRRLAIRSSNELIPGDAIERIRLLVLIAMLLIAGVGVIILRE